MTCLITNFKRHYSNGLIVADNTPLNKKVELMSGEPPGHLTSISWTFNKCDLQLELNADNNATGSASILPDASGFIVIYKSKVPDNCLLIDAKGNLKSRLSVPWQLTKHPNITSNTPPTCFLEIAAPRNNPTDGNLGKFGILAWVELQGLYYFELDLNSGKFIWGKEIYD